MTIENIEDQFAHIRNALANAGKALPERFKSLVDELKAEALAEKLVVEHGVQHASNDEIEQEFVSLDAVENDKDDDDFENDENLVDMERVSDSMLNAFGE